MKIRLTSTAFCRAAAIMAIGAAQDQASGADATFASSIRIEEGEHWFGGAVNLGVEQPYDVRSYTTNGRYGKYMYDLATQCWGGATVPFLLSDKGRYVWSDRPFRYHFNSGTLQIISKKEMVEPTMAGATIREAYLDACRKHFPFTGQTPPEEFFVKPQFNNWIEMYLRGVNQEVCEAYADEIATNNFPCGVHMVDGGWMLYHGAVRFNPDTYPDPVRLFDKLHGYGWKSLLWFAYFVSPDSRLEYRRFRYFPHNGRGGYAKGLDYLLHVKDPHSHAAAVLRWWSGISCAYDLTNPEVFTFFVERLKKFAADYHFDGYKFDAGNPEFVAGDCRFHEAWMEPCDYAKAWNDVGQHIPYNEYRSGFMTGGRPIVQRLHDQPHTWEAQAQIIKDMIVAGLLGYPYTVPDMIAGGLCGSFGPDSTIDHKLFVRSCQLQSLMPMMQFSLAPWRVLTKEECDICRDYANLHVEFGPYIMELARHAANTGEPILRSMDWEFPGQGFDECFTQFMLGGDWLVAPVITPDDAVTVRLPAGSWRDDLGREHNGPTTISLEGVPLSRLPRFRRLR